MISKITPAIFYHSNFFHFFSMLSAFSICIFRECGYIIIPSTARWCNGSTSDSGSFSLGSSPGRAATLLRIVCERVSGASAFFVPGFGDLVLLSRFSLLGYRVGGCPLAGQPSSHTTVRTVPYTAVSRRNRPFHRCVEERIQFECVKELLGESLFHVAGFGIPPRTISV